MVMRKTVVRHTAVFGMVMSSSGAAFAQEAAPAAGQAGEAEPSSAANPAVVEPVSAAAAPAPTAAEKSGSLKSTLSFEVRTDLQSETYKDQEEVNEGDDKSLAFRFQRARLGLRGDMADNLKYRVRFRFDKSYEPKPTSYALDEGELDKTENTYIDGVGEALDLALIDYRYADFGGIQFGRFNTEHLRC